MSYDNSSYAKKYHTSIATRHLATHFSIVFDVIIKNVVFFSVCCVWTRNMSGIMAAHIDMNKYVDRTTL